jgi:hypothetical protein
MEKKFVTSEMFHKWAAVSPVVMFSHKKEFSKPYVWNQDKTQMLQSDSSLIEFKMNEDDEDWIIIPRKGNEKIEVTNNAFIVKGKHGKKYNIYIFHSFNWEVLLENGEFYENF